MAGFSFLFISIIFQMLATVTFNTISRLLSTWNIRMLNGDGVRMTRLGQVVLATKPFVFAILQ